MPIVVCGCACDNRPRTRDFYVNYLCRDEKTQPKIVSSSSALSSFVSSGRFVFIYLFFFIFYPFRKKMPKVDSTRSQTRNRSRVCIRRAHTRTRRYDVCTREQNVGTGCARLNSEIEFDRFRLKRMPSRSTIS